MFGIEWLSKLAGLNKEKKTALQWTEKELKYIRDWSAAIKYNTDKEKKMTRKEAIDKLPEHRWYGEHGQKGFLLDALEALGLIKFEEEKKETSPSLVVCDVLNKVYVYGNPIDALLQTAVECVNALIKAGYRIVKNDTEPKVGTPKNGIWTGVILRNGGKDDAHCGLLVNFSQDIDVVRKMD